MRPEKLQRKRRTWTEEGDQEEVHQKEVLPSFLPTVEELSGWRSPPPQQQSMQTRTGPAGKQSKEGKKNSETHMKEQN